MNQPYLAPFALPTPAAGPAAGTAGVTVRGIEVVQTVQDAQNTVVLISGKTTVVRVYLDAEGLTDSTRVSGELALQSTGGETYVPSMNNVLLDPAAHPKLPAQRGDLKLSLNFKLPGPSVATGPLRLRLSRLSRSGSPDLPVAPTPPTRVNISQGPVLRVRVVGLRYRHNGHTVAPGAIHFAYLRSFLGRTYPVSAVDWSHIVVDANFQSPFSSDTAVLSNAQLAAMRSQEVSGGVDPRTHYYGLVDDNGGQGFMRGLAFTIPTKPSPDVVASGPAGVPVNGFAGDHDASYADWYGAHELGHTFGRRHPGFPPGQQDASDPEFPYPQGLISPPDGRYIGLDVGDGELGLPMLLLPGSSHHDVMTYAESQWLSPYTYNAIHRRLVAEEALQ